MRVAVIGAGIVGVTTAYELAHDGHAVTVFERHGSVAAESSFATGCVLGSGALLRWSSDALRGHWLRALTGGTAALRTRPGLRRAEWRWLWRLWRSAGPTADATAPRPELALARYSSDHLRTLTARLHLEFERAAGLLVLLRTPRDVQLAQAALGQLRAAGVAVNELGPAACYDREPGLHREQALAGGILLPDDESANCRQFAHLLRDAAEQLGVEFRFVNGVRAIGPADANGQTTLQLDQLPLSTGFANSRIVVPHQGGASAHMKHRARAAARYLQPVSQEQFDAVVVAAGSDAPLLLVPLGLRLPLQPVHGYSLTAPLRSPERGPQAALIDARDGLSIARIGLRMRVAGGAELGGSPTRQRRDAVDRLFAAADTWFPGAAHIARPQVWKGARPMLPDGAPRIGPGPRPGIWLNLGHGGGGWSLACGSARLLADQIAGRAPALDPASFNGRLLAKR